MPICILVLLLYYVYLCVNTEKNIDEFNLKLEEKRNKYIDNSFKENLKKNYEKTYRNSQELLDISKKFVTMNLEQLKEVLSLVLQNKDSYPYAEERRLFYVALTRTKNKTYLLVPDIRQSIFYRDLKKITKFTEHNATDEQLTIEQPICPKCRRFFGKKKGLIWIFFGVYKLQERLSR